MSTKVALVTGAASGIGAAIATRFKQNGWQVASIDKNKSNTDLFIEADVSDFKSVNDAVLKIEKELESHVVVEDEIVRQISAEINQELEYKNKN